MIKILTSLCLWCHYNWKFSPQTFPYKTNKKNIGHISITTVYSSIIVLSFGIHSTYLCNWGYEIKCAQLLFLNVTLKKTTYIFKNKKHFYIQHVLVPPLICWLSLATVFTLFGFYISQFFLCLWRFNQKKVYVS